MWDAVSRSISEYLGCELDIHHYSSVSGGCINEAFRVEVGQQTFFVKRHQKALAPMFQAEYEALKELEATHTIQVPTPIGWGIGGGYAWLVTSFLELENCRGDSQFELGRQLASLHQIPQPYFGWKRDNTIGSIKQPNKPSDNWISFWREHRLEWQMRLARDKGGEFKSADLILDRLELFFEDYKPQPALLHGDLWNGNVAALPSGLPVIFDPASYYGDSEAEFGIIEMFGGFSREFDHGYQSIRPRHAGFSGRLPLYRLYHELNHFNLFGSLYTSACESSIRQLLRAF